MKYFAVVFAAVMALSIATPVEVEERQGDIINMIINMLKNFICNMQEVEVGLIFSVFLFRVGELMLVFFSESLQQHHCFESTAPKGLAHLVT